MTAPARRAMKPPPPPTDAALLERCLDVPPDAAAFELLHGRHARALSRFLSGMFRGEVETTRDALQETFLRFWRARATFTLAESARPVLLRIARNVALDHLKRKSTQHEQPGAEAAPDPVDARAADPALLAAKREAVGLLREAVYDLPPDERAVFLLKHDQGMTYDELADALGCATRTAKYRMKSALERLGRAAERIGVDA